VRAGAEIRRTVRQRRSGRTDEDTAGGTGDAPDRGGRCASVAERCGVELGDHTLRTEAAEHRDRYPVLAGTRTDCQRARRRKDAPATWTGDGRRNATDTTRSDRVAGAAAVVEVQIHPPSDVSG